LNQIKKHLSLNEKKAAFKKNLRLDIEYNGFSYHGWQVQGNLKTIQNEIEENLAIILQEKGRLYGASRTDAGVHAKGQVANYFTNSEKNLDDLKWALNKRLSPDIQVKQITDAEFDFDARRSAKGKHYKYRIWISHEKPVFYKNFIYWFPCKDLDIKKMIDSSKLLIGNKDFSSFGSNRKLPFESKIRNITKIDVNYSYPILEFDIFGESFLYKMVRGISGTLFEIGRGKDLNIENILGEKNRSSAGRNLPGHGLFLMEVFY
jgi:tRNA pseudouridine38-40 synthase